MMAFIPRLRLSIFFLCIGESVLEFRSNEKLLKWTLCRVSVNQIMNDNIFGDVKQVFFPNTHTRNLRTFLRVISLTFNGSFEHKIPWFSLNQKSPKLPVPSALGDVFKLRKKLREMSWPTISSSFGGELVLHNFSFFFCYKMRLLELCLS